jgi:hypothetical protein
MIIVVLFCSNTICHIKNEIILKGKDDGLVRTQRKSVTYFRCCPKCTYGIPFILGATFNSAFSFCLWCLTVQCKRDQSQVENNKRIFTGLWNTQSFRISIDSLCRLDPNESEEPLRFFLFFLFTVVPCILILSKLFLFSPTDALYICLGVH